MSNASLLKVYDGQEPDLCFGSAPGPGGVNSVGVGLGLSQTGSNANPVVNLGMSAVGDLLVGTGFPNSGAVLGKGANGQFLRVKNDGTGLEYAAVAPGGVDSVSAVANNVGLVLTTAPASPTDPQIGLAFSAKADIPVGTAANTGIMCSAPLPLTSGLVLQTDTAEPSGVKWAPAAGPAGVISTNAPLNDAFSAGNNTISIAYTAGVKGEIPVGGGTLNTGLLLPCSGNKGDVLSVLPTAPSGLAWVTPSSGGGGSKILRGTGVTPTPVGTPSTASDTLIIIAEENSAVPVWVPVPPPATPAPYTSYNIEFEMLPFILPNGGGTASVYGVNTIVNSQKVVEIYTSVNGAVPVALGHFYNSLNSVVGKYDYGASVAQCLTGPPGPSPGTSNFEDSFLFCGTFNFFHFEDQSTPQADIETHNIAQLVFKLINAVAVPIMGQLFATAFAPQPYFGLGLTQTAPQISNDSQVNRMFISAGVITFVGCFNAIQQAAGDMKTGGGNPIAGYASIIDYSIAIGEFVTAAAMLIEGLGVYANNYPAQPAGVGVITDIQVISATKYFIVGEWAQLAIDATSQYQTPQGFTGQALWDSTLPTNKWTNTPAVPSPVPGAYYGNGYTLRQAVSFPAGYYIFTGVEYTPAGAVTPRVYIYNSGSNVVTQATGDAQTLTINDIIEFYNGVTGLTIDLGTGPATHDFVSILGPFSPINSFRVLYFTGGSVSATYLTPNPTGLVCALYPPTTPGAAIYYLDPEFPSFGINPTFGAPSVAAPNLVLGTIDSKEQWTLSSGGPVVFSGDFYYDNVNYTTATFAPTAGTNLDSAQMLVATKDQLGWINVGAKTTSLTYS